jgi:hypothetical protein
MENTTENKERVFELVNNLMLVCGDFDDKISSQLDEVEYNYVGYMCQTGRVVDDDDFGKFQTLRCIKDLFKEVEEIANKEKECEKQ